MDKEDFLLSQIDEFREKAKKLQQLLNTKETKVKELQNIVDEREGKAEELQTILDAKKKQADGINQEVAAHVDGLIGKVNEKFDWMSTSINNSLLENQKEIKKTVDQMETAISDLQAELKASKAELSDKIHTEDVQCFRNMEDLIKEQNEKLAVLAEMEEKSKATHVHVKVLSWFSVINFVVLVAYILYSLGIFNM